MGRLGWVGDSGFEGDLGARRGLKVRRDLRDFGGGGLEEGEIGLNGRLGV